MFRLGPLLLAIALVGCSVSPKRDTSLQRFEFEQPQMGVPFRIVLYARGADQAETAAVAAFRRIEELNASLSDYDTDSELSLLSLSSEQGAPVVPVGPDLWKMLSDSQRLSELTGGAFDITAGPCVALWRKARREQQMPDPARLESARNKVGYQNLKLDQQSRSAQLLHYGMRLDLGAIAKGYAADEALKTLRYHGLPRALVAASGDLALGDAPPDAAGWRVEIEGYDQPGGPVRRTLLLANHGVATSGDLVQRVEINGVRYSHIVSPFTCVGMTNHALATVIARDCTTADSLATACTMVDVATASKLAKHYKADVRIARLESGGPVVWKTRSFPVK